MKREKIEQRERRSGIKKCYIPEYKVITKERILKEKETLPQQYTKIIISKSAMMIALLQTAPMKDIAKRQRENDKNDKLHNPEKSSK